jgi:hypothetical protein
MVLTGLLAVGYGVKQLLLPTPETQMTFIERTLAEHPVVVFSKSYCGFSLRAKQTLSRYLKDYHVVEVSEYPTKSLSVLLWGICVFVCGGLGCSVRLRMCRSSMVFVHSHAHA